jgi:uncharacterized membrane protein YraQ (UPF0718 family)
MLLILSIFALFLGPFTYRLLQRQPGWLDLIDAFIFVTISGLVLFHILPELLHEGGLFVLVLTALGLLAPSLIEKYFHQAAHKAHNATLFLGVLGLVVHASLDGTVLLADQSNHTEWLLALGVLLHRFPVGLTIWWLLRPQYGAVLPFTVIICMSVATLLGASYSELSFAQLDGELLAWFQAFVMGSIMHVVLHRPYLYHHKKNHSDQIREHKYAAGIGSFLGLIVLGFVLLPHWLGYIDHIHGYNDHDQDIHTAYEEHLHLDDDHIAIEDELHPDEVEMDDQCYLLGEQANLSEDCLHTDETETDPLLAVEHYEDLTFLDDDPSLQAHNTALVLENFANLALYTSPMLLVAYLLSAFMHYLKPVFNPLPLQKKGGYLKDAVKGALYGLPLPICSPEASKMHQQLLGLGVNQTFATAFLIATPIIGFDALLISFPLLGGQLVLLRLVFAVILAIFVAWVLGRHFKKTIASAVAPRCQSAKPTSRFITAIKQGYQHQLDHTAPWVILGWALAATLSATPAWAFFEQALWLQVLVMVAVAFPFALCATGITPVIAVMLIAGLSPGAAIACLLIGPSISVELLKQMKQQQGYFAALAFAMLMLVGAFLIGLSLNEYIDSFQLPWLGELTPDFSWLNYISLSIILVLYFISLLRRGARSFIAELLPKDLFVRHHHHH